MAHHRYWSPLPKPIVDSPLVPMAALTWVLLAGNHHPIKDCHLPIQAMAMSIPNPTNMVPLKRTCITETRACVDPRAPSPINTILASRATCGLRPSSEHNLVVSPCHLLPCTVIQNGPPAFRWTGDTLPCSIVLFSALFAHRNVS